MINSQIIVTNQEKSFTINGERAFREGMQTMNIYDIAAEAKTSISTVSRVLNNKGNVNPEIRQRVEEVLK